MQIPFFKTYKLYSKSKQFNSVVLSAEICGLIPETLAVIAKTLCIYYKTAPRLRELDRFFVLNIFQIDIHF